MCFVQLDRVSLKFTHIYEQLFNVKFQAFFLTDVITYCEERKSKLLIYIKKFR